MTNEVIELKLDDIDKKLDKILVQATRTNGRVTSLEMWRERMKGTYDGGKMTMALLSGVCGLIGAAIGAFWR